MKTELEKRYKEKKNICIYFDEEEKRSFVYGQVIAIDDHFFAIKMVSPDGIDDGLLVKLIDDVLFIEESPEYDLKMNHLMDLQNYSAKTDDIYHIDNDNVILGTFEIIKRLDSICSVEILHSGIDDFVGKINRFDEQKCEIVKINEYGKYSGNVVFRIKDISQICFNSSDERRLMLLQGRINS